MAAFAGTPRSPAHYFWAAFALLDAFALAYVVTSFDWGFEPPPVGATPAGWIIEIAFATATIVLKALLAAFVVAVAFAIVREIRGNWRPHRLAAALMTPIFLAVLALITVAAVGELREVLTSPAMQLADRLVVFDRLAKGHKPGQSLGAYIAFLCIAAYLAEKYLLRWWNLRWPLSLLAVAIIAWPVRVALDGEREQREWVAAQQWRPVSEQQTWLEALASCNALGSGWRLARPFELSLYLGSSPEASRPWRGTAWTLTESELGRNAVVVELAARRGGYWRANSHPWRGPSLCEGIATPSSIPELNDWFAALRPKFCVASSEFEGLHVSTVQPIAVIRGQIVGGREPKLITSQTQAATICIKPSPPEIAKLRHRIYPKEREFQDVESFLAAMRSACNPPTLGSDPVACSAFGAEARPVALYENERPMWFKSHAWKACLGS